MKLFNGLLDRIKKPLFVVIGYAFQEGREKFFRANIQTENFICLFTQFLNLRVF